jgi:hypothetical protein
MTLTLRPDRAFIPPYRDHQDWTVFEDGKEVGRIYEDRLASTPAELRWFWAWCTCGEELGRQQLRGRCTGHKSAPAR